MNITLSQVDVANSVLSSFVKAQIEPRKGGVPMNCPYCKQEIDYGTAYGLFVNQGDYETYFQCPCPHCEKVMAVTVESIPEFRAEKVKCDMCGKGVPVSNPYYCDKCMDEIKSRTISSPI